MWIKVMTASILIALEKSLRNQGKRKSGEVTRSTNWIIGGWAHVEPSMCRRIHKTKLQWTLQLPDASGLTSFNKKKKVQNTWLA